MWNVISPLDVQNLQGLKLTESGMGTLNHGGTIAGNVYSRFTLTSTI